MAMGNAALVKWVTEFLELETPMKKVDEMSSAICYAQLLDALFPGKVPVTKINFNAKNEYDLINNWKVIQGVFTAQGISKPIDVAKLVKGKTQDNLEFCQWFKTYFDSHHDGSPYPAREKRSALGKKPPVVAKPSTGSEKKGLKQPTATPTPPVKSAPAKVSKPATIAKPIKPTNNNNNNNNSNSNNNTNTSTTQPQTPVKQKPSTPAPVKKTAPTPTPAPSEPEAVEQQQEQEQNTQEEKGGPSVEEYNHTLGVLRETIEGLEKERNYYFKRLQHVESYCQKDVHENPIAKRDILAIVYLSEEADAKDESARRSSQEAPPAEQPQQQQQQQEQVQSQNEVLLADDGLLDAGAADGDLTSY